MATSISKCCVCDRLIDGEGFTLGGRHYCATHYRNVTRERRAAAQPIIFSIIGTVVFVALVAWLADLIKPSIAGEGLVALGVVLAIVPAFLWLVAFYYQDRLEHEPKGYVLGVLLLGAILAQGVGQPLIRDVFKVQSWLGADLLTTLLGMIFVVGFVQEFLKYAVVRYTVYRSVEFDERVDGIIYSAAAGLGYATMLNLQYVVSSGGVDLGVGALRVAVAALAQASFSGVVGYFLGRAKFEAMGVFWLPIGLTLAAVLNGIVNFALGEVTTLGGVVFNPWYGLVLAAVVAGATFVILFTVIRRLNAATLASAASA
ncbi:MAG: PrsW family glutamic-type intramembrane protease [Dehalococcoidia bacterium]|nr:PrsW family glutamic-type intramembrane protease [Dehalococcoidia bacterium]